MSGPAGKSAVPNGMAAVAGSSEEPNSGWPRGRARVGAPLCAILGLLLASGASAATAGCAGMAATDDLANGSASTRPGAGGAGSDEMIDDRGAGANSGAGTAGTSTNGAGGAGGSGSDVIAPDTAFRRAAVDLSRGHDFGAFRASLGAGAVPLPDSFDAGGFFAEHATAWGRTTCGERLCIEATLGAMHGLRDGEPKMVVELGVTSPVTLTVNERRPLSVVVVVDVSGSMRDAGKLGHVRSGLAQLVNGLVDGDAFGLVTFATGVEVVRPLEDLANSRDDALAAIQALQPSGGTNLYGGLQAGYRVLEPLYDKARQNRVILLSDGQPSVGIVSEVSLLEMSRGYNAAGLELATIGLGGEFNEKLLRELAAQGGGAAYSVTNAATVSEVFLDELERFTVPLGFDLEVRLEDTSDFLFGRAFGSPYWADGATGGGLGMPNAFATWSGTSGEQTERAADGSPLLVALSATPESGTGDERTDSRVAVLDFTFREPGTNRLVKDRVELSYPWAPWTTPALGYFGPESPGLAQQGFLLLEVYEAIEAACGAFHTSPVNPHAVSDAGRDLLRMRNALLDFDGGRRKPELLADVSLLKRLAELFEAAGYPPTFDPDAPDDAWPPPAP